MPPRGQKIPAAVEMGQRIRVRRRVLKLSQEDLAERAGYHSTYVSSVERGERNATLVTILRIAQALEIDPGRLIRGLKP